MPLGVFRRLNDGLILKHGGDCRVRKRSTCCICLQVQERDVVGEGKEGKDRLVRVDWSDEKSCEISSCLLAM